MEEDTRPPAGRFPEGGPLWKRVLARARRGDLANQAAKVAYYFFLSLPPAVMALFGATGLLGGDRTGDWIAGRLFATLPAEAGALVDGFVAEVVHESHPGALSVGALLALWGASNLFMALEDTLNQVYGAGA
ncbi:MAG TPA: YhjD/YihY/BrkB family envelope integrity protein, partial [Longimicrobiaceae bacterium]|nr:YhjD/YihY/BrkB family envelope integrity protein [Longimicrobiaceae bacterium]